MSAPTGLGTVRTGAPDNTNGIKLPEINAQEDSTIKVIGGVSLSDQVGTGVTADRGSLTGDDTATTDMSTSGFAGASGANLIAINNRGTIVVWATFVAAGSSCAFKIIYYDSANNPLFVGQSLTLSASNVRLSASGDYMSVPQIVESYGASKYRVYLDSKGSGNVSLFSQPI